MLKAFCARSKCICDAANQITLVEVSVFRVNLSWARPEEAFNFSDSTSMTRAFSSSCTKSVAAGWLGKLKESPDKNSILVPWNSNELQLSCYLPDINLISLFQSPVVLMPFFFNALSRGVSLVNSSNTGYPSFLLVTLYLYFMFSESVT